MGLQDGGGQTVIALQDYTPQGDHDLPLQKDQEYTLISSANRDWWNVQDDKGCGTFSGLHSFFDMCVYLIIYFFLASQ